MASVNKMRLVAQERARYIIYPGTLISLGFIMSFFGVLILILTIINSSSANDTLRITYAGVLTILPMYLTIKGFSRQRFGLLEEGLVPFWKDPWPSERKRKLVPWSVISFVSRVDIGETFDGAVLWVDVIVEQRMKRTVGHVIDPRFMENYTESTLERLKLTDMGVEVSHFDSTSQFKDFLQSKGIDTAVLKFQSGRFSVPAMTG